MELSKLELNSSDESLNALRSGCELLRNEKEEYVDDEILSLKESKMCLKLLCTIQTGYAMVWFVVVLALENINSSNGMALIYALISCALVSLDSHVYTEKLVIRPFSLIGYRPSHSQLI